MSRAGFCRRCGDEQPAPPPAAITAFERQFPDVAIEIVSEAAVLPWHALLRNEVDVAIVSSPDHEIHMDKRRFTCRKLIRDEFVALLPARREKAGRPYLLADDFLDETCVTNSAAPEQNRE
jgi:DNA-binding transcriptional LysR family regulator